MNGKRKSRESVLLVHPYNNDDDDDDLSFKNWKLMLINYNMNWFIQIEFDKSFLLKILKSTFSKENLIMIDIIKLVWFFLYHS